MWEEAKIFILVLLAICGGIITILTAAEKVGKIIHPYRRFAEIVADHGRRIDAHDKLLDNDNRRLNDQVQLTKRIYQMNLALLNHFIDGNGKEQMKELREAIQNDLVDMS